MSNVMEPPKRNPAADYIDQNLNLVKAKNPAEPEFHQAVLEVFESLRPGSRSAIPNIRMPFARAHRRARARADVSRALVRRPAEKSKSIADSASR
jgi:hypothetical protein